MTETIIISLSAAVTGGLISFLLQNLKFKQELKLLKDEHKTLYTAETTAIHFLSHKKFTDRSFEMLKERLGGFEDDELRKILVRAGAVRFYRNEDPNDEWWRLLSRMEEYIERKKQK